MKWIAIPLILVALVGCGSSTQPLSEPAPTTPTPSPPPKAYRMMPVTRTTPEGQVTVYEMVEVPVSVVPAASIPDTAPAVIPGAPGEQIRRPKDRGASGEGEQLRPPSE